MYINRSYIIVCLHYIIIISSLHCSVDSIYWNKHSVILLPFNHERLTFQLYHNDKPSHHFKITINQSINHWVISRRRRWVGASVDPGLTSALTNDVTDLKNNAAHHWSTQRSTLTPTNTVNLKWPIIVCYSNRLSAVVSQRAVINSYHKAMLLDSCQ